MSKKSYLKLLFSFELDSKISNFMKNRAASCQIFPILGTACPIGHEAALRPISCSSTGCNSLLNNAEKNNKGKLNSRYNSKSLTISCFFEVEKFS